MAKREGRFSDFWTADYGGGGINVCVYSLFFPMATALLRYLGHIESMLAAVARAIKWQTLL